jgi:hypothetical protein
MLSRWFLAQLIFSTLKMEAICSSETSVDFERITWSYIPEDGTVLNISFSNRCIFTDVHLSVMLILDGRY